MRTTLNLDDQAITEAQAVSPGMTKTGIINEALRQYARRRRVRRLSRFRGRVRWQGNLDELRRRTDA